MGSGEHGGDAAAVATALGIDRTQLIDLSLSVNPAAPDVARVLIDRLDGVTEYPDPTTATRALAEHIDIDPARLVLTNGGAEAIALVASTMVAGDVRDPEFSLYRRHLPAVIPGAPRWRSNPSNPLGRLAGPDDVADVWDEAFWPLATGTWTDRRLDDAGVWRLGSLTKTWACPGLRLGYAIAPDEETAETIRRRQPRWSVGSLALAVVEPLLGQTDLVSWSTTVATSRTEFLAAVRALGYAARDTEANWILVDDVDDLRSRLIAHGIVVRDCTSFGLAGTSRVAVPRREHFDEVIGAFTAVARET